jgi:hypothetical protein
MLSILHTSSRVVLFLRSTLRNSSKLTGVGLQPDLPLFLGPTLTEMP